MSVTPELLAELRVLFAQKLEVGIPSLNGPPHPADAERVKDDSWLKKFLDHQDLDVNQALQMLIDACVWRKTFGTNDISEATIRMEYMHEGLFYPRGRDIDGCTVLIFKSKKHTKGQRNSDELKRCVVYWFERLERVEKCKRISVFFDMSQTGLSNMDMDFTRYLISLFKSYYPDFLNYILIYDMPWVLNAAFKVIKTLLPAKAVAKMKFISSDTVKDYIPLDQAQKSWGGDDDYTYAFIPEPSVGNFVPSDVALKKVHFADPGTPGKEIPTSSFPAEDDESSDTKKVTFSPPDRICFISDGKDISGTFTVTNNHDGPMSYKVKTTSPEKFRVRPSTGVLASGASQVVNLLLLEGYQFPAVCKEKFLIMWFSVPSADYTQYQLTELWKDVSNTVVEQHRFRCTFPSSEGESVRAQSVPALGKSAFARNGNIVALTGTPSTGQPDIDQLTRIVETVLKNQNSMSGHVESIKTIMLIILTLTTLLLAIVVYFFCNLGQKEGGGEFCTMP